MNAYFITNNEFYIKDFIDRLRFENLIGRGQFQQNTCIWMGWQKNGDKKNENWTKELQGCFNLHKHGIEITKGTIFPESVLWDNRYDDILVFGTDDELKTYIRRLCVFAKESNSDKKFFPHNFIYLLECKVIERKGMRNLDILDRGFLFESDEQN